MLQPCWKLSELTIADWDTQAEYAEYKDGQISTHNNMQYIIFNMQNMQTYQTKRAKPDKTKLIQPGLLNQGYQTKPKVLVKAVNA